VLWAVWIARQGGGMPTEYQDGLTVKRGRSSVDATK
jgi:hypothetical protein